MLTTNAELRPPIRTCVGCRRRSPRSELHRFVLDQGGRARPGAGAPGRGAWLCGPDCLDAAVSRRGFDRAWRTTAPASVRGEIQQTFELCAAIDAGRDDEGTAVRSGPTPHARLTTRVKG